MTGNPMAAATEKAIHNQLIAVDTDDLIDSPIV